MAAEGGNLDPIHQGDSQRALIPVDRTGGRDRALNTRTGGNPTTQHPRPKFTLQPAQACPEYCSETAIGAVSFVHRFGSPLNKHLHFQCWMIGGFESEPQDMRNRPLPV